MEKLESIIAGGIILLIILVFFFVNLTTDDSANLRNNSKKHVARNLTVEEVSGSYEVKKDKNTKLQLNEDGTYNFNLNICGGYLELQGVFEIRDKKLYLINRVKYEEYENLNDNEEFHFTIVDENTLKLEEDLQCVFRETLFEK
jgi:hypothetical protein